MSKNWVFEQDNAGKRIVSNDLVFLLDLLMDNGVVFKRSELVSLLLAGSIERKDSHIRIYEENTTSVN